VFDSEEAARSICGKDLYLPLSELPKLGSEHFYFHEVAGWRVQDLNSGEDIGTISRVIDYRPYPMLEVEIESVELILPLPKNFKVEVDRENQVLRVEIPEGLLEVFLNPGSKEEEENDNLLSDDFFQQ
jgi:16S rRNA processing protein RimM